MTAFPENVMPVRSEVVARSCYQSDRQTDKRTTTITYLPWWRYRLTHLYNSSVVAEMGDHFLANRHVAYRPLVEMVALFALTIRCRGLHTADINDFIGRTTNFSYPRVRFIRDHFFTQGRLA